MDLLADFLQSNCDLGVGFNRQAAQVMPVDVRLSVRDDTRAQLRFLNGTTSADFKLGASGGVAFTGTNGSTLGIDCTPNAALLYGAQKMHPALWCAPSASRWSHVGGLIGGTLTHYNGVGTWNHEANLLAGWVGRGGTLSSAVSDPLITVNNLDRATIGYQTTLTPGVAAAHFCGLAASGVISGTHTVTITFDTVLDGSTWRRLHSRPTSAERYRAIMSWYKIGTYGQPINIRVTALVSSDGTATSATVFNEHVIYDGTAASHDGLWVSPVVDLGNNPGCWVRQVIFELTFSQATSGELARLEYVGLLSNMPVGINQVTPDRGHRFTQSQTFADTKGLRWETTAAPGPWNALDVLTGTNAEMTFQAPHAGGKLALGWYKTSGPIKTLQGVYENALHKLRPYSVGEPVALGDDIYRWQGAYFQSALDVKRSAASDPVLEGRVGSEAFPRLRLTADGLALGSGGVTLDTALYRGAADLLATDDTFRAGKLVSRLTTTPLVEWEASGAGTDLKLAGIASTATAWTASFFNDTRAAQTNFLTVSRTGYGVTGIAFLTSLSPHSLTHNGNTIWTSANDGANSGLDADTLDGNQASAFATATHVHSGADITSGYVSVTRLGTGTTTPHSQNFLRGDGTWVAPDAGEITGLGAAAFMDTGTTATTVALGNHTHTGTYAPASHNHDGSHITTGTVPVARLGTNAASATTFLNGGNTWSTVPAASVTGLGGAAVLNVGTGSGTVAAGDHKHAGGDITSGVIGAARLGNNTPTTALWLRGNATTADWTAITASAVSGLGGAATLNVGTIAGTVAAGDHNHSGVYALASHPHSGADITSGTVADARLPASQAGKTFTSTVTISGGGLACSGTPVSCQAAAASISPSHFAVFETDPTTSGNTIRSRSIANVKSDLGIPATYGTVTGSGSGSASSANLAMWGSSTSIGNAPITVSTSAGNFITVSSGYAIATPLLYLGDIKIPTFPISGGLHAISAAANPTWTPITIPPASLVPNPLPAVAGRAVPYVLVVPASGGGAPYWAELTGASTALVQIS